MTKGAGDIGVFVLSTMLNFLVRLIIVYVFANTIGVSVIYYGVPIGWFVGLLIGYIRYKSEKEMERYPRLLSSSVLLEVSSPVKILATNMVQTANVHRLVNCLLAWLFKDCVSKIVTSYIILINNKIHYIAYFIIG